jgi:hypothetical protein
MRPTDCALLMAVPLQRSEFMADLAAGTDFLERFVASQRSRDLDVLWAIYDASAATAAAAADRARRRGVTVVKRAVLADFTRCLQQFRVVTLVAHWRSDVSALEFADGAVPLGRVVTAVPCAFDGVLDLTMCNSTVLTEEVRRRCRRTLIIANRSAATLDIRMEFYNAAMDLVQRRQVNYEDAVLGARQ